MTFLLLLKSFWPALIGVAGVLFGIFKHQQAATATAEKQTADAKASQMEAQAVTARADAVAAKTALDTVQTATADRASVDASVNALPASDVDAQLRGNGFGS